MNGITGVRPGGAIAAIARLDNVSLSLTNAYGGNGAADPMAALITGMAAHAALRASATTFKAPTKSFKSLLDIKV